MMLSYEERPPMHGGMMQAPPPPRAGLSPKSKVNSSHHILSSPPLHHRHIWIITGPAGCGKTTVAKYIAENLQLPYIEGDEYHPQSNVRKMAAGIPLTDEDRWDWLVLLRKKAVERLSESDGPGVVLTCSALRRKYRDVIRIAGYYDHQLNVHFIYLNADEQTLMQRVRERKGHYMKDSMVHSQFATLEKPEEDERDCLSVDARDSMSQVQRTALHLVQETLDAEA